LSSPEPASARLAAPLAARDDATVDSEDRCKRGEYAHHSRRCAYEGNGDSAAERQDETNTRKYEPQGQRAAGGRSSGEPGGRIVVVGFAGVFV
jgi:hypothetical protein